MGHAVQSSLSCHRNVSGRRVAPTVIRHVLHTPVSFIVHTYQQKRQPFLSFDVSRKRLIQSVDNLFGWEE